MPDDSTARPSSLTPPPSGADNYALGKEIATGGMGSVLEAEDAKLQRTVAIKVMLLDGNADETMRRRFIREAQVLAMLAHPNIVPIHDMVWEDGLPLFYSMKLVKGRTLAGILKSLREEDAGALREFSLTHLLDIFRKVCDAIAFAHSRGVLHRDLKPENVMVGEFGEVLVMDWGLAKILNNKSGSGRVEEMVVPENGPFSCSLNSSDFPFSQTLHGAVLGTPQYMAPEQAQGHIGDLDERADIYALGGILYAILTLQAPVAGMSAQEVMSKVTKGEIIAPSDLRMTFRGKRQPFSKKEVQDAKTIKPIPHLPGGRVPGALSSVAMKALQLEKERRYESVVELGGEIESFQSGFATFAEQAGAWTQIRLLMFRHKVFSASLLVLLITSFGFVWKIVASERRAQDSVMKSERSLATAQLLLADAAFEKGNAPGMVAALNSIPKALRDGLWDYYSSRQDSSLGPLKIDGFREEVEDVVPMPHQPGRFAIASRSGKIGIVDVVSKKLLRTIDTEDAGDIRIAISGDGTRLLSRTGVAGRFHLFETSTGEKLITANLGFYKKSPSPTFDHSVALNEDGTLAIFSFPARKEIRLFEMEKGTLRWTRISKARQMLFHPDGKRLIVARDDEAALDILDVTNGQLVPDLPDRTRLVNAQSLSLGNDGRWLAASLFTGELVLIGMDKKLRMVRKLSANPVAQMVFTSGDNLLTLDGFNERTGIDRALEMFEPIRGNPLGTFLGLKDYPAYLPLRFNRESGHLLTIQSPPQLWHFPDKPLAQLEQQGEIGLSCNFVSDTVLLARKGVGLDFYDVSDPQSPVALDTPLTPGHGVTAAHPKSGLFATAVAAVKTTTVDGDAVKLMQLTPDGVVDKWVLQAANVKDLTVDLRFDATAERLVRVGAGTQILSTKTGEILAKLPPGAYRAAFAGTQGCVVTIDIPTVSTSQGLVQLIDPATGETRASLKMPFGFHAVSVSPDNQYIAVAGNSKFVLILDADTLEEKHRFFAHNDYITALCFHPTKALIATGSPDHSVKIWDFATGRLQQTFLGFKGNPMHLAFSPDGRLLAVDGMEYSVNILSVDGAAK